MTEKERLQRATRLVKMDGTGTQAAPPMPTARESLMKATKLVKADKPQRSIPAGASGYMPTAAQVLKEAQLRNEAARKQSIGARLPTAREAAEKAEKKRITPFSTGGGQAAVRALGGIRTDGRILEGVRPDLLGAVRTQPERKDWEALTRKDSYYKTAQDWKAELEETEKELTAAEQKLTEAQWDRNMTGTAPEGGAEWETEADAAYRRKVNTEADYAQFRVNQLKNRKQQTEKDIERVLWTGRMRKVREDASFDALAAKGAATRRLTVEAREKRLQEAMQGPDVPRNYSNDKAINGVDGGIEYDQMTTEELKIYDYFVAKGDKDAAREYLAQMQEEMNRRLGVSKAKEIRDEENPVIRGLATAAYGLGAGLNSFGGGLQQAFSAERIPTSPMAFGSEYIREDLADTGPKLFGHSLGQIGYGAAELTGGLAPRVALGAVNPALGVAVGSASTYGNTYNQALSQGYDKGQARSYAMVRAAMDGALQYAMGGISKLGGGATGKLASRAVENIDHAALRVAADVGIHGMAQGTRDYLLAALDPAMRNWLLDEDNDVNLISEEAAYAFLTGFFTAGVMRIPGAMKVELNRPGKALAARKFDEKMPNYRAKDGTDYFDGVEDEAGTKARYRQLARENHPDMGGDSSVMQEINRQYEMRLAYYKGSAQAQRAAPWQEQQGADSAVPGEETGTASDMGAGIVKVEDIKIEPSARTSVPGETPAVQPVNAIDGSVNTIPQTPGGVNRKQTGVLPTVTLPKAAMPTAREESQTFGNLAGDTDISTAEIAAEAQKNAPVEGAERVYHGQILDTVRGHLDEVRIMPAVAHLTGGEFQKQAGDARPLRTRVTEFFNSLGNKVTRPDIGDIALTGAGARDSTAHGYGKLKAATFAAIPSVLKDGKIIEVRGPYGGHSYDSIFISAPVEVDGVTHYVGALVIKDANTQRYKLHEVLTTNESGTPLFKSETTGNTDGPLRSDAPLGTSGDVPTISSIPQTPSGVNRKQTGVFPTVTDAILYGRENGVSFDAARRILEGKAAGQELAPRPEGAVKTAPTVREDMARRRTESGAKNASDGVIVKSSGISAREGQESLGKTLARSIEVLKDMGSVAQLTGQEMSDRAKKPSEQISTFFSKIGSVFRKGFGKVSFGEYGVGGMLNHRPLNRAKMVTLEAVPSVIKNGRVISDVDNWKGRGYRSVVFAAPVRIAESTAYVAAVVNQNPDGKFYLSECVDSDGNYIRIENNPSDGTKSGVTAQGGITATPEKSSSIDRVSQMQGDVKEEAGDAGYWESLMETAERGEAVNQGEEETEAAIQSRIGKELNDFMDAAGQVQARAEVRSDLPDDRRGAVQKAKAVASSAYRQFVDSGAEIEKMGRVLKDKTLYPYYNAARSATSAAGYMLQQGGRQISVAGEVVGPSLADIFQPIRAKGDDYYIAFQTFLYHMHNIDRMSRDNSANIDEAMRQLNAFDEMLKATRPELATMQESDLMREVAYGDEDARQRVELLNAYNRAKMVRNKPVFSDEVTAEMSRAKAAELLRQYPEFAKLATRVYTYSDNLLQYRVDSGLVTQEFADTLRKTYPHYVPTYRVTEGPSAGGKKKGTRVWKTVGRATGGNSALIPLHTALARQTAQVVRNGTLNRLGQRILGDYEKDRRAAGKYIYKVDEAQQSVHEDTFDLLEDPTPERENTFTIYQDGKALRLTMSKGMYQAIDALTQKSSGWRSEESYRLPAKATSLFKELTTGKNPGFLLRNFFRDLQEGAVYSESTIRWLKNFPKAYQGIIKNSPEWQLFQSLGGVYSSVFDYQKGYDLDGEGKKLLGKSMGKVEAANSIIEMAPRFAEFLAYLEKHGRSEESVMEALNRAAEVTTNFGKGGEAGKFLNRTFVPFLNPGIQGASKMIKTAFGRDGARACLKLWLLGAGVLGLGARVLNDLVNGDDEDYKHVRDSVKDTNWLIPIGGGRYIKIPMGRDASSLGVLASRLIGAAHGDEVDWADAANTIMNQSAPSNPLKTNILAAWIDAALFDDDNPGKTWYGGNIESQRLQNLAPGQRFDEDTDYFSKWLGGVLGKSPKKINYILDQYSGVVGEYVLPLITPSKNKSILSTFTSNFILDGVTQNSLSSDFYAASDKIKYAKNGGDGAMAVVSRFWGKQSDAVSDLNKALRELENDTTISNKEKQKKIREAKAVIGGVQKNALGVLEEYEAAARKHYTGDSEEAIKRAYRETNREVFGAEYALQTYNKKIYERAVVANQAGVDFDTYYEAYFATRGTDGKEMNDNQKRKVLKGMNVPDDVKIALYTDLITDDRDDDIQAAQEAGLPFDQFLEAQSVYTSLNKNESLSKKAKRTEFKQWMHTQVMTAKQEMVLGEAFKFYTQVPVGETTYEKLYNAGWSSGEAGQLAEKIDALEPLDGKDAVSSLQKCRVIVDNGGEIKMQMAALETVMTDTEYMKLASAYDTAKVSPKVWVCFREHTKEISNQKQVEKYLDNLLLPKEAKAALWQMKNTGWKPQNNPYDKEVSRRVYAAYKMRAGE